MTSSDRFTGTGVVPIGWAVSTLAEATQLSRARGQPSDYGDRDFIGLEHIEAHTTRLIGCVPASTMRSSGVVFKTGDVLYGRMRPYLNKVWVADRAGLCSGEFIVFGSDGALRGTFLKYRLNAQDFVTFADRTTSGDRPRADFDDLGRFPVLVPPAAEQRRIERQIDELLADLNAGVAALERVKRNLVRYRAAVLHAAVTGQLTTAWRERNGSPSETGAQLLQRILAERHQRGMRERQSDWPQRGQLSSSRVVSELRSPIPVRCVEGNEPPKIPACWTWASVEETAEVQGGIQKSPKRAPIRDHYPYLRVANVHRGRLDLDDLHRFELSASELERLRLAVGDLLIVEGNGSITEIGRSAIWQGDVNDCVHQNHIIRVRFGRAVLPAYADAFINSPLGQLCMRKAASSTSGLHTLSVGKIKGIEFPLPPLDEQQAIVDAVSERTSQIDTLAGSIVQESIRSTRLRQAILKVAFEGRLVLQDPSDEPASVLLERIRDAFATPCAKKPRKETVRKTAKT